MRYFLIAALVMLTACTHRPIPFAVSYPLSSQHKMQAAHHWDVLAENVASRLKDTIDLTFPNAAASGVPIVVYVRYTKEKEEIPFAKTFHGLLRNHLVQNGIATVNNAEFGDVLIVDYDMQVILHKDRRLAYPPPGLITALAAGVWGVSEAAKTWNPSSLAAIPVAVGADALLARDWYLPGETNAEVVISTTATRGQQYIFGNTGIYYINAGDYDHYEKDGKNYQVVNQ